MFFFFSIHCCMCSTVLHYHVFFPKPFDGTSWHFTSPELCLLQSTVVFQCVWLSMCVIPMSNDWDYSFLTHAPSTFDLSACPVGLECLVLIGVADMVPLPAYYLIWKSWIRDQQAAQAPIRSKHFFLYLFPHSMAKTIVPSQVRKGTDIKITSWLKISYFG